MRQRHETPFFTPRQLYEALEKQIGINTLYSWLEVGRIKSIRVGKKYLIPKTELQNLASLDKTGE